MGDNGTLDKESAFGGYANLLTIAVIFTWEFSFISASHFEAFDIFDFLSCAAANPWKQYAPFLRTQEVSPPRHNDSLQSQWCVVLVYV